MLALIFAGGNGSRLKLGEKALVTIGGRAMLSRVTDAFIAAGITPLAVTSHKTPYTRNYCRTQGIEFIDTAGTGYMEDLHEAVELCGETGPIFTAATDIPYLTADIISEVLDTYLASGKEACSTWIPLECCKRFNTSPRYCELVNGIEATPCALNIFLGEKLTEVQTEVAILLKEPTMAFNVNTREELASAEKAFKEFIKTKM